MKAKLKTIERLLSEGLISSNGYGFQSRETYGNDIIEEMLEYFDGETYYDFSEVRVIIDVYCGPHGYYYNKNWLIDEQEELDYEFNKALDELINQPWIDWEDIK